MCARFGALAAESSTSSIGVTGSASDGDSGSSTTRSAIGVSRRLSGAVSAALAFAAVATRPARRAVRRPAAHHALRRPRFAAITCASLGRPWYARERVSRPGASLPPVPSIRSIAASVAISLLVAACGSISTSPPAPTPADFQGIAAEIVKRSVVIDDLVSGDAGCDDPALIPTAIAFDAKGLDQAEPVRIYLYIFRNRASFEKLRASVDFCARSFVIDPDTYQTIEQSPFVLAGQGPWAPRFQTAIREALEVAAGTGD
jgi:hypothetical protein